MREIFYEIIEEAKTGIVTIDGDKWPIGWNTIIYENGKIKQQCFSDENLLTLIIKDENKYFELFEKYINIELMKNRKSPTFICDKEKNHIKILMTYLFANATTEDFINPLDFIKRNISFLEDDTFNYLNEGLTIKLNEPLNCNLKLQNKVQSIFMETPNKIEISLEETNNNGEILTYQLPSIYYGITEINNQKKCYIYSILNKKEEPKTEENEKFIKKISRKLYKINKGVREEESKEYNDYKEGISSYYPENISDVSPSQVLSLTIFLSLLKKENIKSVKGVPYLPVRYSSRNYAAHNQKDEERKIEMLERNNFIQSNITEKFIRTIRRAAYHMEGIEIISLPYEVDEFITLEIDNQKTNINNELLNEVTSSINKQK